MTSHRRDIIVLLASKQSEPGKPLVLDTIVQENSVAALQLVVGIGPHLAVCALVELPSLRVGTAAQGGQAQGATTLARVVAPSRRRSRDHVSVGARCATAAGWAARGHVVATRDAARLIDNGNKRAILIDSLGD